MPMGKTKNLRLHCLENMHNCNKLIDNVKLMKRLMQNIYAYKHLPLYLPFKSGCAPLHVWCFFFFGHRDLSNIYVNNNKLFTQHVCNSTFMVSIEDDLPLACIDWEQLQENFGIFNLTSKSSINAKKNGHLPALISKYTSSLSTLHPFFIFKKIHNNS